MPSSPSCEQDSEQATTQRHSRTHVSHRPRASGRKMGCWEHKHAAVRPPVPGLTAKRTLRSLGC